MRRRLEKKMDDKFLDLDLITERIPEKDLIFPNREKICIMTRLREMMAWKKQ